jgi:LysR family transcriptional regulator for bpeEF and oprC
MNLEILRTYVQVVQSGSFSGAAKILKVPKSTVSRSVSRLEAESGTKLLLRTTRKLKMTDAGRMLFENCVDPIRALDDAQKSILGVDSAVSGLLRITAPEDLGTHVISAEIAKIRQDYPLLRFEITYTDRVIDMVQEGYDIAFRIGKLPPTRLRSQKLGEVILVLVAAPSYLSGKKKILNPRDLLDHDCLSYSFQSASTKWNLKSSAGNENLTIHPKITSNQMTSLMRMAIDGAGIAFIPAYLCREEIERGRLVPVLRAWHGDPFQVSMLSPLSANMSARLRVATERLSSGIRSALKKI